MMLYEDITKRIIAAAMQVHSTLGNGFQEVIYQRTLEIEMPLHTLTFSREMEMPIFYRDQQIGTRRVDFFVEGKVMVETINQVNQSSDNGKENKSIQTRRYSSAYTKHGRSRHGTKQS